MRSPQNFHYDNVALFESCMQPKINFCLNATVTISSRAPTGTDIKTDNFWNNPQTINSLITRRALRVTATNQIRHLVLSTQLPSLGNDPPARQAHVRCRRPDGSNQGAFGSRVERRGRWGARTLWSASEAYAWGGRATARRTATRRSTPRRSISSAERSGRSEATASMRASQCRLPNEHELPHTEEVGIRQKRAAVLRRGPCGMRYLIVNGRSFAINQHNVLVKITKSLSKIHRKLCNN
jgi:hypothetical protein